MRWIYLAQPRLGLRVCPPYCPYVHLHVGLPAGDEGQGNLALLRWGFSQNQNRVCYHVSDQEKH